MTSLSHVVLICEDGWEGIRRFALLLSENNVRVSVIIKGNPGREVRQMITPMPEIRNYFFNRNFYRIILIPLLVGLFLRSRWQVCCVTKQRVLKEISLLKKWLGVRFYEFVESGSDSLIRDEIGNQFPFAQYPQHFR